MLQLLRKSLIVSRPGPNRWQFSSIPASTYRNQSQAPKEAKRSHWNLHSSRFATWISSSVTGSRQFEKALSPQVQSHKATAFHFLTSNLFFSPRLELDDEG